jgi:hypothetical protein
LGLAKENRRLGRNVLKVWLWKSERGLLLARKFYREWFLLSLTESSLFWNYNTNWALFMVAAQHLQFMADMFSIVLWYYGFYYCIIGEVSIKMLGSLKVKLKVFLHCLR